MMKKMNLLLTMFGLMTALLSCGGSDDDGGSDGADGKGSVVISLRSQSISEGAEVDASTTDMLTLTYTATVKVVDNADITLNGQRLSARSSAATKTVVEIPLSLQEGTSYQLRVAQGAIVSTTDSKSAAPALTLNFKTRSQKATDGHESATEAVKNMIAGWNLGNTLDAWSSGISAGSATSAYETCWGQPVTEEYLMKKLSEKGFTAIRVPVTWMQHMDASGTVDAAWMDRVEQVVQYVLNNGMYCILNVHHDTGADQSAWLKAESGSYASSALKFKNLWTQIANRFKGYSDKLLFEGYNEMLTGSNPNAEWSQPKSLANLEYINKFAKDFVDAVRATGGNNQYRNLIVTTYSASHGDQTLSGLQIPTDPCGTQAHLAVEVHSYDPYNWVNTYNMQWTSECSQELAGMFNRLNNYIISRGYPVIVGEYGSNGAEEKTINKNSTDAQKAEAAKQAADMTRLCKQYGAAAFYWMGIVDGNDRKQASFRWSMEQVADAIVNGK
ncbi:MAG: glycoside hydrolase family 5 protein [Prevotella sp.]|nr:glycoside hydrolase family 5 protein [Prevotella sp.]